jgi:uncharacterized membrane protein YtjA (UPF0391 family)
MLRWTVIFLVIAIIAGIFGFFGIAASAAYIAKILFFIFVVLFVVSLIFGKKSPQVKRARKYNFFRKQKNRKNVGRKKLMFFLL